MGVTPTTTSQCLEEIAVITSRSSTTSFNADILERHIKEPLLGRLVFFIQIEGNNQVKLVLAQITEMLGINMWHEDYTLRSVVKRKGRLDYLSGETDIKYIRLSLLGVYEVNLPPPSVPTNTPCDKVIYRDTLIYNSILQGVQIRPSSLFTPPLSGTYVYLFNYNLQKAIIQALYGGHNIVYLGYIYGSNTPAPFNLGPFTSVQK
ncbi:MAG: hypothetical protein ACP5IE_06530 [Infirmifilum sp.]